MANSDRRVIDKVLVFFGVVTTLVLIAFGLIALDGYHFANDQVTSQLAAQKIYFPPLGSSALASPEIGPYLNQYAGKQLLTGPEAEAYANHFIAVHLSEVADGQTYSQVSEQALANPTNTQLKAEEQTLFQGETLRGLLLGDGYAYWKFGDLAKDAAIASFIGAGVMLVLVVAGMVRIKKTR
ncbi:MAG TPA: hypothetical protein VL989_00820 [Candidatus Sulfotelmatobacter sp.]|nr:hypothetical protein [Candidatus Sulfotelmatobacter sp.]